MNAAVNVGFSFFCLFFIKNSLQLNSTVSGWLLLNFIAEFFFVSISKLYQMKIVPVKQSISFIVVVVVVVGGNNKFDMCLLASHTSFSFTIGLINTNPFRFWVCACA